MQREPSRRSLGLSPRQLSPTSSNLDLPSAPPSNDPNHVQHVHSPINPSEPDLTQQNIFSSNPGNTTTISGSSQSSHTDALDSLTHQSSTSTNFTNQHDPIQISYPHVSEASSNQYNSAFYPPGRRNPYLMNNFPSISTPITYQFIPSSHRTISSFSAPMTNPLPHQPNPDHHLLSQLHKTIDNLNNTMHTLHNDLDAVRRQLHHSNQQNSTLQQQLLHLTQSQHHSPPCQLSMRIPPVLDTNFNSPSTTHILTLSSFYTSTTHDYHSCP